MQQYRIFDQAAERRAERRYLLASIGDEREVLILAHDRLRNLVRDLRDEGYVHAAGFVSASRAEIMSAIDSLNVAERYLA